jgi:NAD-dependent deacetylase
LTLLLNNYLSPLYIPFLTLPFNLTVIALLISARIINPEISGLFPVRLASVTTPEKILKEHETAYNNLNFLKFEYPFRHLPGPISAMGKTGESGQFLDIIKSADKISILSGAGTSTDSGIPDFRGNSGFWDNFSAQDFTYQNFMTDIEIRKRYWDMDRLFYRMVMESGPNETHRAVKRLEDMGKLACIVTQNVDGLFQQAGVDPAKVIEVHGTIHRARCINCAKSYRREDITAMLNVSHEMPLCKSCNGHLKPETVLMGETLEKSLIGAALFRILTSDLLIVIGASLMVDPVASIPDLAWQKGVRIIIINLSKTPKDGLADMIIRKNSAKFFKEILNYI